MAGSASPPVTGRGIAEMFASYKNKKAPVANPKSYAEVTSSLQMPTPISNAVVYDDGEYKSVKINPKAFEKRIQMCNFSLIGRLNLNKGDAPWKLDELYKSLGYLGSMAFDLFG
ncbi:hypothetical protein M5689_021506 [Euphorbia peplus]|nr:hypothetical protein M5689_021506 [Euphorbia peplus]